MRLLITHSHTSERQGHEADEEHKNKIKKVVHCTQDAPAAPERGGVGRAKYKKTRNTP